MRYLVVLAAALAAAAAPVSAATADQSARIQGRGALEGQILVELNDVRAERGLQPLRVVTGRMAVTHSRSMLAVGFFDHASADGTSFDRRLRRHYPDRGWSVWSVGETPSLDVRPWTRDSSASGRVEPHREVISATWRVVGIGARYAAAAPQEFGGAPTTVVTADFGLREGERRARVSYAASERNGVRSIDLDRDASIQRHPDEAADVDVLDVPRSPAQRPESSSASRTSSILVPTDTCLNAGRKEACADGIHGTCRLRRPA